MRRTFTQLTQDERRTLAQLLQKKTPKTQIAEILGRDRSTIHRELKRNWWHDAEIPEADGYWRTTAQTLANEPRLRQRKLVRHPKLRAAAIDRLKEGWSPEQSAGRLKTDPRSPYRLCHETIYQYVYSNEGQSLELARYLPSDTVLLSLTNRHIESIC